MPDAGHHHRPHRWFPRRDRRWFAESLAFVKEMTSLADMLSLYSLGPGREAARMKGQVRPEVRKERNASIARVFENRKCISSEIHRKDFACLWESTTQLG